MSELLLNLKDPIEAKATLAEVMGEVKKETFLDKYDTFRDQSLKVMREALEANFPDNWEIIENKSSIANFVTEVVATQNASNAQKLLDEGINGTNPSSSAFSSRLRRASAYIVYIRFPEVKVENSRRVKHTIKDMFIRLQLSPFFNDVHLATFFMGKRTTFTYAEACSNYTFSHLNNTYNSDFGHFCLGHTHFKTLCMDIARTFNPSYFELFCQQLGDYLCWESLEGTPYKYMKDIHERGVETSDHISISSSDLDGYYDLFLRTGYTSSADLKSNSFYYSMVLPRERVTDTITSMIKNKDHLMYWDPVRKVATPRPRQTSSRTEAIDRIVRDSRTQIKFKGEEVSFIILDRGQDKPIESDEGKTMIAHTSIIDYIVNKLNQGLSTL